jgi:prevent-host-death family protein
MNVGVKELKNSLSRYLRAVHAGEIVLVTDRGKVIAEIRPRSDRGTDDEQALSLLEQQGIVTCGRGRPGGGPPVRIPRGVSASKMVLEDRR